MGKLSYLWRMNENESQVVERHCDVVIVGGSAAGLAAALQLGRQRRSVIVIDSGEPRNAPADHMHGYLGHEGVPPREFSVIGRAEVRSYGVEFIERRAVNVTGNQSDGFRVELEDGHAVVARRVLAATGLTDELPDIAGVAELWGCDVIHCPFCHGFEVRDRRIVQIVTHPVGLHPTALFRQLTDRLTVVLHEGVSADHPDLDALRAGGVGVVDRRVRRVVAGDNGRVAGVELDSGDRIDADAVVVSTRFRVRAAAFVSLGLQPLDHPSGLGDFVETDQSGQTSVPGLYAAGNLTDPSQQVLQAAAEGSRVGAMISFSLAHEDVETQTRVWTGENAWDHRYGGGQVWSGDPNASLVAEMTGVKPGRALDVGAGEGGDAMWLAEQGWKVTAADISRRALQRIATEADRRGLVIDCLHADANTLGTFEAGAFDLVSAHYATLPRTPDRRAVRNLIDAVAPGGTLLVVSHDLEASREPSEPSHRHLHDPDAYVSVDEYLAELTDSWDWVIDVHEKRPRPVGSASPHIEDIILRSRRLAH